MKGHLSKKICPFKAIIFNKIQEHYASLCQLTESKQNIESSGGALSSDAQV